MEHEKMDVYPNRRPWHGFACPSPFLAAPVAWVTLHSPHSPNASPRGSTREGWRGEAALERERGLERGREEVGETRGASKKIGG